MKKNHYNSKLNTVVKLGRHKVGDNYPTYIIAEAGLNHNGDLSLAKKLINEAKKAMLLASAKLPIKCKFVERNI